VDAQNCTSKSVRNDPQLLNEHVRLFCCDAGRHSTARGKGNCTTCAAQFGAEKENLRIAHN